MCRLPPVVGHSGRRDPRLGIYGPSQPKLKATLTIDRIEWQPAPAVSEDWLMHMSVGPAQIR